MFRLKRSGVTLVLTTHYMDEAEQLCDRLVVMDHGKIVAEGSPRQLIDDCTPPARSWSCAFDAEDHKDFAEQVTGVGKRVEVLPDRLLVYTGRGRGHLRSSTRAESSRCRRWSAARPSRTSSST